MTFCIRSERWLHREYFNDVSRSSKRRWMPLSSIMSVRGLDLFHSFGNHLPLWSPVPTTFTIHDFRALDNPINPSESPGRLRRNIKRAAGIICLTEHGRGRLEEHFPGTLNRHVAVIPHGVNHRVFYPRDPGNTAKVLSSLGLTRPYLLQLGSWFPHKNPELSIRAFADTDAFRNDHELVFVGGGGTRAYKDSLASIAADCGVSGRIKWFDHLSNEDLPFLVSGASCLVHPSRYEGFCLPILEAMACGLPGVVSDSSCLPEVSGGVWPVVAQDDVTAFAAEIDRLIFDSEKRQHIVSAGLERAQNFTWKNTALLTTQFFADVLEKTG
ncbi:MAG: glycosyltransferase family 4 protein [Xanthomonadales bacterium]|nr:glycosyltransferase family 4 protein [Xanthomonadales bacterium]